MTDGRRGVGAHGGPAYGTEVRMRQQGTAPRLAPSRDGVLFVSGFATSLQVERGHLLVRTGSGRRIREARLSKVGRPRIRRLVVFGKGGFTTFEALAWLHGVGASFCHLSRSGEILAMSAHTGPDQPALRRAQVLAGDSPAGLEVVRHLLRAKLQGQLSVLREHFVYGSGPIDAVSLALASLEDEPSARKALAWEAKAASAYWRAWSPEPIRFARADEGKIPEHWPTFGD